MDHLPPEGSISKVNYSGEDVQTSQGSLIWNLKSRYICCSIRRCSSPLWKIWNLSTQTQLIGSGASVESKLNQHRSFFKNYIYSSVCSGLAEVTAGQLLILLQMVSESQPQPTKRWWIHSLCPTSCHLTLADPPGHWSSLHANVCWGLLKRADFKSLPGPTQADTRSSSRKALLIADICKQMRGAGPQVFVFFWSIKL